MPNPFYQGQSCHARAMADIESLRYNAVRAAGWSFDHGAGVWRHEHTGRTGLNQHVIHECLRNHDAMPPCGPTRADTPSADRALWVARAARLREIEAATLRSPQVQIRATAEQTEEQTQGEWTVNAEGITVRRAGWSSPRVAQAVARARIVDRRTPDRGYSKVSEGWAPNYWEA